MIAGAGTTIGGYYTPFLYLSTTILAIGTGMLTTWEVDTNSSAYLGWQAMAGIGMVSAPILDFSGHVSDIVSSCLSLS